MYKEQEKLKSMKTHREVHKAYVSKMADLPTYNTVFFPVRVSVQDTLVGCPDRSVLMGGVLNPFYTHYLRVTLCKPSVPESCAHFTLQRGEILCIP